jgi:hypothetical protein
MYFAFITDFTSFLLLAGSFYLLWRQKDRFYSLTPLLPAIVLVSIGRICDMVVEHPSFRLSNIFGLSPVSSELLFAVVGNITDAAGILILIYGFTKIIKYQRTKEKEIRDLETLLPLCSNCKNYRTEEGHWMPIEKYLIGSGAPKLTHGICPDCAARLYGDILKSKPAGLL